LFKGTQTGTPDRYNKVQDNFFAQGANTRNSSECATPGLTDFANKTLYIMEELPKGKLYVSKLKQVTSRDDARGRGLHQSNQTIKFIGKLIINANQVPDLGEEAPVWDRAVFIPFDTRYVNVNEKVDEKNWRLPSNNEKKNMIVELTSAFMTVCLKELHRFIATHKKNNAGDMPTNIPLPECVQKLIDTEKEKAFALKVFIKKYTREAVSDNTRFITMTTFFNAYRGFCRQRNIRSYETLDNIVDKLPRAGIQTGNVNEELVVCDRILTAAAIQLADREAINTRQIDVPNPDSYAIKRSLDVQQGQYEYENYKRQRPNEEKEE
jgi:hypothetical protein